MVHAHQRIDRAIEAGRQGQGSHATDTPADRLAGQVATIVVIDAVLGEVLWVAIHLDPPPDRIDRSIEANESQVGHVQPSLQRKPEHTTTHQLGRHSRLPVRFCGAARRALVEQSEEGTGPGAAGRGERFGHPPHRCGRAVSRADDLLDHRPDIGGRQVSHEIDGSARRGRESDAVIALDDVAVVEFRGSVRHHPGLDARVTGRWRHHVHQPVVRHPSIPPQPARRRPCDHESARAGAGCHTPGKFVTATRSHPVGAIEQPLEPPVAHEGATLR